MLAAFGIENPSPTQMMTTFFNRLPFYYLHSLSCFSKLLKRRDSAPNLYIDTYDRFETTVCDRGINDGTLKPLKKSGAVTLRFESATEDGVEEVVVLEGKTSSCVDVYHDVFPRLVQKAAELWEDIPPETLVIRSCGKSMEIPRATTFASVKIVFPYHDGLSSIFCRSFGLSIKFAFPPWAISAIHAALLFILSIHRFNFLVATIFS